MSTPQPTGTSAGDDASMQQRISKTELLQMIVQQLQDFGYKELGGAIAIATGTDPTHSPSGRLLELASLGKAAEEAEDNEEGLLLVDRDMEDTEIDEDALVIDEREKYEAKTAPNYSIWFTTSHKAPVKCASFSPDGR